MTDQTTAIEFNAAGTGIDWKRLFTSFSGRIGRKSFWAGFAVIFAASMLVQAGVFAAVNASDAALVAAISSVIFIYPALAVYAKRCHDRGRSAWWLLILFVPVVGVVWLIWELGVQPGTEGANAFGTPPAA